MTPPVPHRARVLESLYQHRLLSAHQLKAMLTPDSDPTVLRRVLRGLVSDGYVTRVRLAPPSSVSVWFLTEAGAQVVERSRAGAWVRRYLVSPEAAKGPLLAHTLAANEVGVAFMAAARRHGDECGYLAWRHEVAHKLPDRQGAVICDLLLHYVAVGAGDAGREHVDGPADVVLWRFVEVDRGTEAQGVLVEKLQDYVAMHRAHRDAAGGKNPHPPRWVERYASFPPVMVVFCGLAPRLLRRRIRSVAELCRHDPVVSGARLPIVFTTLDDLASRGPFEAIFWLVGESSVPFDIAAPVDVLGGPGERGSGPLRPVPGLEAVG